MIASLTGVKFNLWQNARRPSVILLILPSPLGSGRQRQPDGVSGHQTCVLLFFVLVLVIYVRVSMFVHECTPALQSCTCACVFPQSYASVCGTFRVPAFAHTKLLESVSHSDP